MNYKLKIKFLLVLFSMLTFIGCKDNAVAPDPIDHVHRLDKPVVEETVKAIREANTFLSSNKNVKLKKELDKIPDSKWFRSAYLPLPIEGLENTINGFKFRNFDKNYITYIISLLKNEKGITKLVNGKWIFIKTDNDESSLEVEVDGAKLILKYYNISITNEKIKFTFEVLRNNLSMLKENYILDGKNFTNDQANFINKIHRDGFLINEKNIKYSFTYDVTDTEIKFTVQHSDDSKNSVNLIVNGKKFIDSFLNSNNTTIVESANLKRKQLEINISKNVTNRGNVGDVLIANKIKAKVINLKAGLWTPHLKFKHNSIINFWPLINYLNW